MRALERRIRAKDIVIRGLEGLRAGGNEDRRQCIGATGALLLCKGAKVKLSPRRGYVGREEVTAVGGPGVLLGLDAGGLANLEKFVAMG